MKRGDVDVERAFMFSLAIIYFSFVCGYVSVLSLAKTNESISKSKSNFIIYHLPAFQIIINIIFIGFLLFAKIIKDPFEQLNFFIILMYFNVFFLLSYFVLFVFYSRKNISINREFVRFRIPIFILTLLESLISIAFLFVLTLITGDK